ncbi:MAG: sugar transferase [Candidatus Omnitrophota bacterium]|jgi:exopolysaccharide biosynthesis polyprenyl glycosylphosphotransferase
MLKQHADIFRKLMIFADLVLAAASFILAYFLSNEMKQLYPLEDYLRLLPYFVVVWVGLMHFLGMYNSFRTKPIGDVISIVFEAAFFGFVVFSSVVYVVKLHDVSRTFLFLIIGVSLVLFAAEKVVIVMFFRFLRSKGYNTRNILIVGTGRRAKNFAELVGQHGEWGFKITRMIDEDEFGDMANILHRNVIDHVVFVVPRLWFEKIEDLIRMCEIEGIPASVVVDLYELKLAKAKQTEFFGIPMLTFESAPDKAGELFVKRAFDIVVSGLALIILLPVFLGIALAIKATSSGPVFFKQKRCGLNGRRFIFYKFRTMVSDAEEKLAELQKYNEMGGPVFKMQNDPRITAIGRLLRKFSLDELPQLWNILSGDMSVVGPRPPIPNEVDKYDNWQRRRLSMRPGLTCLWQTSGRNEIKDFNQWMKLDLQYIDNWSIWLDLKVFFKTIPVVLLAKGAK